MKAFNRVFTVVVIAIILLFVVVNMILAADKTDGSRQYRVEISRLAREIETNGSADISECEYVTNIERYGEKFYTSDSDYIIYEINGELYRFDYNSDGYTNKTYLMGGYKRCPWRYSNFIYRSFALYKVCNSCTL